MVILPDRRKSARNPSLDDALIRFDDLSLCCSVRDITEDGAALWADQHAELPDRFTLIMPPSKTCLCSVVWRKGGWVGVKFVTE